MSDNTELSLFSNFADFVQKLVLSRDLHIRGYNISLDEMSRSKNILFMTFKRDVSPDQHGFVENQPNVGIDYMGKSIICIKLQMQEDTSVVVQFTIEITPDIFDGSGPPAYVTVQNCFEITNALKYVFECIQTNTVFESMNGVTNFDDAIELFNAQCDMVDIDHTQCDMVDIGPPCVIIITNVVKLLVVLITLRTCLEWIFLMI